MPLTINAPDVEHRLQQEATKQGISANDLALRLLSAQLPVPETVSLEQPSQDAAKRHPEEPSEVPLFYVTATPDEWSARFDEWVNSHPKREPLPPEAFERASFYEDERHLAGETH